MHIKAIRIAGVGRFRDGVALEGLGAGLNVLAAPNEAGKSTLLRALRTLFTVAHSSRGQRLEAIRADGAAAARIQCEFDLDGVHWRLTKQYLAGRSADLMRLDTGQSWAGGDAEDRLTALLSGPGGLTAAVPHLWVAQGESLMVPQVSDDHRQVFQDLVRAEMDAAAGAGRLVQIRARASADLGQLITAGRRQPRGLYLEAQRALTEAEDVLKDLQEKAQRSASRRQRLAEIAARQQALADPAAEAVRQHAVAEATAAIEAARDARQQRDIAVARHAEADTAHKAALARLQDFETSIAELKAGEALGARLASEIAAHEAQLAECNARLEADGVRLAALREDEAAARAAQLSAVREAQRREVENRHTTLSARLQEARTFASAVAAIEAAKPAEAPPAADLAAIRDLEAAMHALEAKAAAIAPSLTIDYDRGALGRFRIAGDAITDGESRPVRDVTRVTADGLGTVTIRPANADAAGLERQLADHRQRLDDVLTRLGVPDRAAAEARAAAAAEFDQAHAQARFRLEAVAPQGLADLEAQVVTAARDLAVLTSSGATQARAPQSTMPDPAAVAERLAAIAQQLADGDADLKRAIARRDKVRDDLSRAQASMAAQVAQLERLKTLLPQPGPDRDAVHRGAIDSVRAAEEHLNARVRELAAWTAAGLDDGEFAAREAARGNAERAVRSAQAELAELRAASREIEGALRRDVEDGIEVAVEEASQKVARLRGRIAGFEADVAGLNRLVEMADAAISAQRAEMAGPIAARMQELAAHVFPGVTFRLGPDFTVQAVARQGQRQDEALTRVSDGTREQIAVLVRLALARCIAEAHGPLPVILDDALVYADDQRLEQTFAALADAAATQQIIVLTCHQRAFAPLAAQRGATQLTLTSCESDFR